METGTPGVFPAADSSLTFPLGSTQLIRFPSTCGVMHPPFTDQDLYSLTLLSAGAKPPIINVTFHRAVTVNQPIALMLEPYGIIGMSIDPSGQQTTFYGQIGQVDNFQTSMRWNQGPDPTAIDAHPIQSATLEFAHVPVQDGDLVDVDLDLVFEDGGVLDLQVRAPLVSSYSGCPAG